MIRPYLLYNENTAPSFWVNEAFSAKAAGIVSDALEQVVNSPNGTGHAACIAGLRLAVKRVPLKSKRQRTIRQDGTGLVRGFPNRTRYGRWLRHDRKHG
jgi:hypothetical protein